MIKLSKFSHGSQTYSNRMESQYLIDTKNFIKTKNHFNPFLNIFTIFSTLCCIYFWQKYTLTSRDMKYKKV